MISMKLRRAIREDQAAVARIAQAAGLFPAAALPDMIAPALAHGAPDLWLVAVRDGEISGFAFCAPEKFTDGTWNLRAIAVDPAVHRCGIGSTLIAAVEAELRAKSIRLLIIETSDASDQAAARAFYVARGYREEARIREFWEEGVAKLVFWKRLAKP